MPTFNSCTKCVGSPGKIHDHMPDCHPVSWAWIYEWPTTERNFDSQATWVIDVVIVFHCNVIHGCLYNQAMADIRSTGAGIKCLYCTSYKKW